MWPRPWSQDSKREGGDNVWGRGNNVCGGGNHVCLAHDRLSFALTLCADHQHNNGRDPPAGEATPIQPVHKDRPTLTRFEPQNSSIPTAISTGMTMMA